MSIHAPLAGCDLTPPPPDGGITISIHAPLAGCDAGHGRSKHRRGDFNPRTPCGVRHLYTSCMRWPRIFQSTHPLRGATAGSAARDGPDGEISIHAPLAGCDSIYAHKSRSTTHFNPRTPCGVRRVGSRVALRPGYDFNPRTPCGVRRRPHTPTQLRTYFNPRTPCGVRPCAISSKAVADLISIHAPLAGCDQTAESDDLGPGYFNPRTPCGVRPAWPGRPHRWRRFQSTHPLRGASSCQYTVKVYF